MTRRGTLVRFAPQSRRTRSWWRGISGRPSPWSCPTAATRRNLARFPAIRRRRSVGSARGNARWRRSGGRNAGRRGTEALPSGRVGRVGRAGRGDNKRTTARIAHSGATLGLWPRGGGWAVVGRLGRKKRTQRNGAAFLAKGRSCGGSERPRCAIILSHSFHAYALVPLRTTSTPLIATPSGQPFGLGDIRPCLGRGFFSSGDSKRTTARIW